MFVITECSLTTVFVITEFHCTYLNQWTITSVLINLFSFFNTLRKKMLMTLLLAKPRKLSLSDIGRGFSVSLMANLTLVTIKQWFPKFSVAWTTLKLLVLCEAQDIDLYRDPQIAWANMADHFFWRFVLLIIRIIKCVFFHM